MSNPKLLCVIAIASVLVLDQATKATSCACPAVWFPTCAYVAGVADVVLHGTALSRSDQVNITDDVTYTMDIFTIYSEEAGETYDEGVSFITRGDDVACGVELEIGEEYLVDLYRVDDQLTVDRCGLLDVWGDVSDEDKAELESGCNIDECNGLCSDTQLCRQYEGNGKWYCSDSCKNEPCGDGDTCVNRKRTWCRGTGYSGCPKKRECL